MYLILREDLAYKYIQGAHALSKFALEYPKLFKEWNNGYLICLSVFNGLTLKELEIRINKRKRKFQYSYFNEPDLESKLNSALCVFENGSGYVSRFVKTLQLAK
jgi:hypothetical protein